jgi:threonine/homoserine/homoserine lactone efflux protein
MIDSQILAFILVAAVVTLTPGADTMLVIRNVLRNGRNGGIATTLGVCNGLFLHAALPALGVSAILMHSAQAFQLVKTVGAFYLVWLGARSFYTSWQGGQYSSGMDVPNSRCHTSLRRCFVEGFLSNVLNPKVALFYLAFLPQFIGPVDLVLQKSLLLAGIHYLQGILWLVTVSLLVDQTRRMFLKSTLRRWLDSCCGALLIGLGIHLAFSRR